MGYRKVPIIYTMDMGEVKDDYKSEDGNLIVRMKSVSFGQVRRIIAATEDSSDENFQILLDAIDKALVSWTLEDEDGSPVPTGLDGVDTLDFPMVMDIIMKWLECMTGVDEDLGKESTSGSPFPGRPVTMEQL